jgi:zinc protease
MEAVFGDHPYARPVSGTHDSLDAITADDLKAYAKARFVRDRLVIGVVGDITPENLAFALDKIFGGLPKTGDLPTVPEATLSAAGRTMVVEKPIPQSIVVFGQPGLKRDDPDWYIASVMNHILGSGGFTSRLTEEVREKRGLAYSIYSYLNPMDHAALIMGGFGTQNARVAESLAILRKEWARMAEEGVTETELENAKNYLNGSFPLRLDSGRRIAQLLVAIQIHDLGIDYMERRPRLIGAVTTGDIARVARRLLKAEDLTVVVVGQPVGISTTN